MICDRGCPFSCIFCSQHTLFGKKVRFRTAQNIVDEVEQLLRDYGVTTFSLRSDTFTLNRQKAVDICDELIRRRTNIKWQCSTRVNCVDLELLSKMKEAGCESVSFGLESGNQKVLDILKKGITIEDSRKAVRMTKKAGLKVYMDFMIGSPGETRETIAQTIAFARELDGDYVQFSVTTPFPGSELFDMVQKEGQLTSQVLPELRYYRPAFGIEGLSAAELEKLRAAAFRSFYLRPRYIVKRALGVRSLSDIWKLLRGAMALRLFTKAKI